MKTERLTWWEYEQKKERVYNVLFDDDDNQVRRISVEMVVEMP